MRLGARPDSSTSELFEAHLRSDVQVPLPEVHGLTCRDVRAYRKRRSAPSPRSSSLEYDLGKFPVAAVWREIMRSNRHIHQGHNPQQPSDRPDLLCESRLEGTSC